jgi:hypothetical protein
MRHLLLITLLSVAGAAKAEEAAPSAEARIKSLEDRLNKIEGAPAKTSLSAFNPAMGMAVDFAFSRAADKGNFGFRSAELSIESPIDPFLKGWGVINGTAGGVEVEEASLQTTALPYNLTVTGGRLFASFGRFAHFHNHELPVIDRPRSLDTLIGGETQADGVEISYLFPTPFYLTATGGVYNKMGGENTRADNAAARPLQSFTYLGRLAAYADLDDHSLELGVSDAWTPRRYVTDSSVPGADFDGDGVPDAPRSSAGIETRKNTWRNLGGADLTYRHKPSQGGGVYQGLAWGTEVMINNERRFDAATNLPVDRVRAFAGFTYLQVELGPHWRPGAMLDLTEDLDAARKLTQTVTAFVSYRITEFHRLRLSYSRASENTPGKPAEHTIGVQWTGIFGKHVHGFRDR